MKLNRSFFRSLWLGWKGGGRGGTHVSTMRPLNEGCYHQPMPWFVVEPPSNQWLLIHCSLVGAWLWNHGTTTLFIWISCVSWTRLRSVLTHKGTVSSGVDMGVRGRRRRVPPHLGWLLPPTKHRVSTATNSLLQTEGTSGDYLLPEWSFLQRETSNRAARDIRNAELSLPIMTGKRNALQIYIW